jgi:retinol-binding protein 3
MFFCSFLPLLLFILFASDSSLAQAAPQQDITINSDTRKQVVDSLTRELINVYVFPDIAEKMVKDIRTRFESGEYDSTSSGRAFAERLTEHLQAISKDKHLRVRHSFNPIPLSDPNKGPSEEEIATRERDLRFNNFGFHKVERLRGNIGYIELLGFSDHILGAETVRSAMGLVANTDALIFDLRRNGGGSPFMVALISTYLFDEKPVHLNSLYWRPADRTDEFWTDPKKVNFRFPNKPVYILTSDYTFSAGEEFTYNLRNLKRATIIGETTGGGAHPGGMNRLSDHFSAFIPTGRAISPITKTNWEGTGVEPHIKVPKEEALLTAHLHAVNKALENAKTEQQKQMLAKLRETLKVELQGVMRTDK